MIIIATAVDKHIRDKNHDFDKLPEFKVFHNGSRDTTTSVDDKCQVTWAAGCDIMNWAAAIGLNPGWGLPAWWRGYPGGWMSKRASKKERILNLIYASISFITTFVRSKVVTIHHWRVLKSWECRYFGIYSPVIYLEMEHCILRGHGGEGKASLGGSARSRIATQISHDWVTVFPGM